jgi:MoxR-like ATPase
LLEAMQEAQVTIDGERFPLEPPFLVIATQNPIELEGTYPLPEAQLDRFLMRVAVGYPDLEDEVEILARRRLRRDDAVTVAPVTSRAELLAMQAAMEDVHVAEVIERYVVDLVRATRPITGSPSAPRPGAPSPSSSSRGRWPRCAVAISCCRTT